MVAAGIVVCLGGDFASLVNLDLAINVSYRGGW